VAQETRSGDIGSVLIFFLMLTQAVSASGLAMYERAASLVRDRYLTVDTLDPLEAITEAAEAAEAAVPWLIAEVQDGQIHLRRGDGDAATVVPISGEDAPTLDTLPDYLERLELSILSMGEDLPDTTDLPVELLRGMARALDRHSVVMHRRKLERFDERIKGKLHGIGARIGNENGELVIREVFPDTPAHHGGLLADDHIRRIDGISTVGMSVSQSLARIRGPVRSRVQLQIERRESTGEDMLRDLVFTRAEVQIPNVTWSLGEDGIGHITIDHFSEQTVRLTRQAVTDLDQGTVAGLPLLGIVLDLRGNSGGSMIQAADTADLFLHRGVIVETSGRDGLPVPNLLRSIRAHPAISPPLEPDVPIVILQDRSSASASEILAGALSMLDRAIILGQTSHGKGTVQKLYMLRSGDEKVRFKLTVAEYRLSDDVPVHGTGLTPDLTVQRIVFNRSGAWIPGDLDGDVLLDVDERQGWRDQGEADRDADPLMDLAYRILGEAAGPFRQDGLDSLERLKPLMQLEAEQRVVDTFRLRGLDWRASDEVPAIMDATADISVSTPTRSGERVEVKAIVTNLGPAPLYQVRIRLRTDARRRPWNNVTIPIGFLPPQERGTGTTMVALPIGRPDREDKVSVSLEADGLDPLDLETVVLRIEGRERPPMAATARLMPHEDHHRVELQLTNHGDQALTGVRARFSWDEDSGVELIDREARLPALGPGTTQRMDLAVRLLNPDAVVLPLQLRVEAEQYQEVLRIPVNVPVDGLVASVAPPTITVSAPVSAPIGNLRVHIKAQDDTRVGSMTVWWKGDKVAYGAGQDTTIGMNLDLPLEVGSHQLRVVVRDEDGNKVRRTRYVRGVGTTHETEAADAE